MKKASWIIVFLLMILLLSACVKDTPDTQGSEQTLPELNDSVVDTTQAVSDTSTEEPDLMDPSSVSADVGASEETETEFDDENPGVEENHVETIGEDQGVGGL